MSVLHRFKTNLWFDRQAEEAAKFYVTVFKNSKINSVTRYGKEGFDVHKMPEGTVMTVDFTLDGQDFVALNGGPVFKLNEAVSIIVNCESQEEIDYYWEKLSADGDKNAQQCGWLKDKFGLSWQVVPTMMADLFKDAHSNQYARVMRAMLQMKKLDIKKLEAAYQQVESVG